MQAPQNARDILAKLRVTSDAEPNAFVFEPTIERKTLVSRIRREWAKALRRSGIAKIRVHDMRHTVGTRLVRSGIDLRTVQDILGHASLKTTQRYLHFSDKLKQQAVEKLSEYGRRYSTTVESELDAAPVSDTIH